jgi:hypothetical protein
LAQQIEALRDHAAREGYKVLEEVQDASQSGASLERPDMDRVTLLKDTVSETESGRYAAHVSYWAACSSASNA